MKSNKKRQELIDLIDLIMKRTGKKQIDISIEAGYTQKNALAQIVSRENGHDSAIRKLKIAFKDILRNATQKDQADSPVEDAENAKELRRRIDSTDVDHNTLSSRALLNLSETNKLLAESHKVIAESNKTLADNNRDLINMMRSTVNVSQQIPATVDPNWTGLLGLIADVASGKRYGSKKEALVSISKFYHGAPLETLSGDTQKG